MKNAYELAHTLLAEHHVIEDRDELWEDIAQAIISARTEMQRNALAKASEAITACGEAEIRAIGSKDFCQGLYQGRLRLIELRSAIRSLNPEGEPQETVEAK